MTLKNHRNYFRRVDLLDLCMFEEMAGHCVTRYPPWARPQVPIAPRLVPTESAILAAQERRWDGSLPHCPALAAPPDLLLSLSSLSALANVDALVIVDSEQQRQAIKHNQRLP